MSSKGPIIEENIQLEANVDTAVDTDPGQLAGASFQASKIAAGALIEKPGFQSQVRLKDPDEERIDLTRISEAQKNQALQLKEAQITKAEQQEKAEKSDVERQKTEVRNTRVTKDDTAAKTENLKKNLDEAESKIKKNGVTIAEAGQMREINIERNKIRTLEQRQSDRNGPYYTNRLDRSTLEQDQELDKGQRESVLARLSTQTRMGYTPTSEVDFTLKGVPAHTLQTTGARIEVNYFTPKSDTRVEVNDDGTISFSGDLYASGQVVMENDPCGKGTIRFTGFEVTVNQGTFQFLPVEKNHSMAA